MRVFHGSYTEIQKIDLSKCQENKDFGKGFYVTKIREQAEKWAKIIGEIHQTKGFVTEFIFYERVFSEKKLKTLRFDTYNDEWFDFIILNRNLETIEQQHDYDIIEGPVADDKVQKRITRYLEGMISREDFFEQLSKYSEPSHQICFCTINSLRMLKKINNKNIIEIEDISELMVEKLIMDFNFDEQTATEKIFSSKTFSRLSNSSFDRDWIELYNILVEELDL